MRVPPILSSAGRSIVASGLKLRTSSRLKRSPKKCFAADVVPVRMRDEDGGQLRQIGSVGAQCLVGGLCGVGAGSCIYSDQLSPVVGNDEIVFRELETRESIDPARNDLGDASRRECVPAQ